MNEWWSLKFKRLNTIWCISNLNAAARNKKRSDLESVRDAKVDKLTNSEVIFDSKLMNNCSVSLITAIQADAEFMKRATVAAIPVRLYLIIKRLATGGIVAEKNVSTIANAVAAAEDYFKKNETSPK